MFGVYPCKYCCATARASLFDHEKYSHETLNRAHI